MKVDVEREDTVEKLRERYLSRLAETAIIESDHDTLGGKPVIAGTRIPLDLVLELFEAGLSVDEIAEQYPTLKRNTLKTVLEIARIVHENTSHTAIRRLVSD